MSIGVIWFEADALVWADGTLDGATAVHLGNLLDEAVAEQPETVLFDLSGVAAIDGDAVAVLGVAAARLRETGLALEVRLPA
jgi:anti-anti-sigma regulatory factor